MSYEIQNEESTYEYFAVKQINPDDGTSSLATSLPGESPMLLVRLTSACELLVHRYKQFGFNGEVVKVRVRIEEVEEPA